MKITVADLRRVIREVLEEEADVPGRWRAGNGEPVGGKDLERLGHGGFLFDPVMPEQDDDDLDESEENEMDQGHEPSSEIYQMNHQGDGQNYDQMGNPKR